MIPAFTLGKLEANLIQGGMGVGISGANLASAVANEGGIGIIASVGLGLLNNRPEPYAEGNAIALKEEIAKARSKTDGIVGVNIMRALTDYKTLVKAAVEADIDLIITGAGPALDLPRLVENDETLLIPIVKDKKGAQSYMKVWGKYDHVPDAIIVEGPKAGGHLAYTLEQLQNRGFVNSALERIVREVVAVAEGIPVIAAGGIYSGLNIKEALSWGAKGVQMATRFVPTDECDAHKNFKQAYIDATSDDLMIIESPVGLPGRAIKNGFLEQKHNVRCGYKCLVTCKPKNSPYCIASALINAQKGNIDDGFVFAGANVGKCDKIYSVKEVFKHLNEEYRS